MTSHEPALFEQRETLSVSADPGVDREAGPLLPRPGVVLAGKYRIEEVIGAGGMGVVVAAMHLQLGERVALKLLRHGARGRDEAVARLLREAQATARIKSEHVARVMDAGTTEDGTPYIVMEYLRGEDLSELLRARGPVSVGEAVDFVTQACRAMEEAHELGIVHRDLKPSNLFRTRRADGSDWIKVLDFGIAKATGAGLGAPSASLTGVSSVLGSPTYMSPEQVRNAKKVDPRTDVWSLGVILHELLAGRPPFEGDTASAVLAAIAADPPARLREHRPGAPAELERIVLACLEKDASRRVPSVAALARLLAPFAGLRDAGPGPRAVAGPGAVTATGEEAAYAATRSDRPEGRRRPYLVAGALVLGAGALLAVLARPASNSVQPVGDQARALAAQASPTRTARPAAAVVAPAASSDATTPAAMAGTPEPPALAPMKTDATATAAMPEPPAIAPPKAVVTAPAHAGTPALRRDAVAKAEAHPATGPAAATAMPAPPASVPAPVDVTAVKEADVEAATARRQ